MTRSDSRVSQVKKLGVVVVVGLAVIVGGLLFMHSGARAVAFCERARFVRSGSLSLWPPGATCSYGEPVITETLISDWFWVGVFGVVLVAVACAAWLIRPRRTARGSHTQAG